MLLPVLKIRLQERWRNNQVHRSFQTRERETREAQQKESGLELLARDERHIHQRDRQETRPGPIPEQQVLYTSR